MRAGAAARALAVVAAVGGGAAAQEKPPRPIDPNDRFAARPDEPELDAAIQIARWLENTAVKLDDGWAWPAVPDDWTGRSVPAESLDSSLYSGSAGVLLFGIALAEATARTGPDGSRTSGSPFAELPHRAAAHLIATLPAKVEREGCGLYTGIAGVGFALREWSDATSSVEGDVAARRCVGLLGSAARAAGSGIEWSDCTDLVSGGAGIGLFLIYMAEVDRDPLAQELAIRAGRHLLDLSDRESVGRSWRMDPTFARVMPNFSHGTAGVAFFLARLYELTGDVAFLEGALDGARHVLSLADTSDGGCRVFHHSNDEDAKDDAEGRALQYMGWCHGPIGTAQLFMKLAQVTGDPDWSDRALQCAKAVRESGIPEHATPGFWKNVGLCCGSAGIAKSLLSFARDRNFSIDGRAQIPDDDPDLAFARRCRDWTLEHGERDRDGLRFPQAEHRVKPEQVEAQVGLMQGAAGVGFALLRFIHGPGGCATRLPDDPSPMLRGNVASAALDPAVPATIPNAVTTAFENLGRGVLFTGVLLRPEEGKQAKWIRRPAPTPLRCGAWLDAARAAGATYVVLDTSAIEATADPDPIAEFVGAARARGFAVGLSLSLSPLLDANNTRWKWQASERTRITRLLTAYGPLTLLRVEVEPATRDWALVGGADFYRAAKHAAPRTLIEFVSYFPGIDRWVRGPNGVQRLLSSPPPDYVPQYATAEPPRGEALWPTDVVADDDGVAILVRGVASTYFRNGADARADDPWRVVEGRRHYVPLQIELPLGRFDRRAATSRPDDRSQENVHYREFGAQLRNAAARARNVLVVVTFDSHGELVPDQLDVLRELGNR